MDSIYIARGSRNIQYHVCKKLLYFTIGIITEKELVVFTAGFFFYFFYPRKNYNPCNREEDGLRFLLYFEEVWNEKRKQFSSGVD